MTSLAAEGVAEGIACFRKRVGHRFSEAFGRRQRLVSAARLGIETLVRGLMDVGLAIFLDAATASAPTCWPAPPRTRGYESLFVTEHTHIPVSAGMAWRATAARSPRSTGARTTRSWRWRSPPRRPSGWSSARASAW